MEGGGVKIIVSFRICSNCFHEVQCREREERDICLINTIQFIYKREIVVYKTRVELTYRNKWHHKNY